MVDDFPIPVCNIEDFIMRKSTSIYMCVTNDLNINALKVELHISCEILLFGRIQIHYLAYIQFK